MRLISQDGDLRALFTIPMEVALLEDLAQQGVTWVALLRAGNSTAIGAIHTHTHEVRLQKDTTIPNRQVVLLGLPLHDPDGP